MSLERCRFSHRSDTELLIGKLLDDFLSSSHPILIISIRPKTQLRVESTPRDSVVCWLRADRSA